MPTKQPAKTKIPPNQSSDTTPTGGDSFILLYQAQKRGSAPRSTGLPRGRPARTFPWEKLVGQISKSDKVILIQWQARFKEMLGRKPGLGEVSGILARICNTRFENLNLEETHDLESFLEKMIGKTE